MKPDSLSYKALMDAAKKLRIEVVDCVDKARYAYLKKQNFKNLLTDRVLLESMIGTIKREVDEK
jgi:hypothetical protein